LGKREGGEMTRKWNTEPYESYYKQKEYVIKGSQILNIIEVLEEWKKVIESFINEFHLLMHQE
jgi:hypothetical protein